MDPAHDPTTGRRSLRRRRRRLIFLAAIVPTWLMMSMVVAHRLTHRKEARFEEPAPIVDWARFESHRMSTSDGETLGAWYAEGEEDGPTVLLLHGNGGGRAHNLSRARLAASAGCSVLAITFRAHGDSTGDYNDIGYSARRDVVAAVEFLERRRPGRPIIIFGASLGAAAATFASGELGNRVDGYILEAPYLDLRSAVRNRTIEALPIGLEWVAYQGLLVASTWALPDLDKISPREAIAGIPDDVPVLFIAGAEDRMATPGQVTALFDRVRSHGKLVIFEKAGHLRSADVAPRLYRETLLDFIARAGSRPRPAR